MTQEEQIIALLKKQDQGAIPLIYKHYGRALMGVAEQIVKDREMARDVLQDSLVKVWKYAAQYDPAKGRLFTWLLNICRNTAIDRTRTKTFRFERSNIQTIENVVSEPTSAASYTPGVEHIGLAELVGKLDERQRVALETVYFGGRTHEEAAEELGVPLGTLKTRIRAALMELRKLM
ncbi:MAG: sigma-70 family RNA polymerase sigma factor [Bacteroidia bacterium]|nr:sigma-70 family RNA polymerase sigma factor [Bacteroidia bacterium]